MSVFSVGGKRSLENSDDSKHFEDESESRRLRRIGSITTLIDERMLHNSQDDSFVTLPEHLKMDGNIDDDEEDQVLGRAAGCSTADSISQMNDEFEAQETKSGGGGSVDQRRRQGHNSRHQANSSRSSHGASSSSSSSASMSKRNRKDERSGSCENVSMRRSGSRRRTVGSRTSSQSQSGEGSSVHSAGIDDAASSSSSSSSSAAAAAGVSAVAAALLSAPSSSRSSGSGRRAGSSRRRRAASNAPKRSDDVVVASSSSSSSSSSSASSKRKSRRLDRSKRPKDAKPSKVPLRSLSDLKVRDGIYYDRVGVGLVLGGTVYNLVRCLLSDESEARDQFRDEFFFVYPYLLSSHDLVRMLFRHYSGESQTTKRRVIEALCYWIGRHYCDFDLDPTLLQVLTEQIAIVQHEDLLDMEVRAVTNLVERCMYMRVLCPTYYPHYSDATLARIVLDHFRRANLFCARKHRMRTRVALLAADGLDLLTGTFDLSAELAAEFFDMVVAEQLIVPAGGGGGSSLPASSSPQPSARQRNAKVPVVPSRRRRRVDINRRQLYKLNAALEANEANGSDAPSSSSSSSSSKSKKSKTSSKKKDALQQSSSGSIDESALPHLSTEQLPSKVPSALSFADLDPIEVAQDLTLSSHQLFQSVVPVEMMNGVWHRPEAATLCPNLVAVIDRFNLLSFWVATEMVSERDLERRVKLLKRFINVADLSRGLKNLTSMMQIVVGLNFRSVQRLAETWSALPPRFTARYRHLRQLTDASNDFNPYRLLLGSLAPPLVPYIGVFLSDLTAIEAAHHSFFDGCDPAAPVVNWNKFHLLASMFGRVDELQQCTYAASALRSSPRFQQYLTRAGRVVMSESILARLSRTAESRRSRRRSMHASSSSASSSSMTANLALSDVLSASAVAVEPPSQLTLLHSPRHGAAKASQFEPRQSPLVSPRHHNHHDRHLRNNGSYTSR
jgi:RasGEF domain/RasGEF N-terminal motif